MTRNLFRALADSRGAAAIEFALIAPVLFVLHVAAAEALQVYKAQRNVAHIAATIADLTAQNRAVTNAQLDDILAASSILMHPFPVSNLQQRVASLSTDSSGTVKVDWKRSKAYTSTSGPSAPSGYLLANESVIVTDVSFEYHPTVSFFLPDTIVFTRHAYARPRLSPKVEWSAS